MNLKQILIALCATSWITSCTKQTSLQEDSIPIYNILLDVNQNPTVPYDSLVRHIEYIPLETDPRYLLGEIIEAAFGEDLIVFNSRQQPIYCFDKMGKFKFQLGNIGIGPGEYQRINGISIAGNSIYLYNSIEGKLLTFDAGNGEFIKQKKFPIIYAKAYVLDNIVYASECTKDYHLLSFPLDNPQKVDTLYTTNQGYITSYYFRKKITRSNGRLFWTNPLWGDVYELKDGKMIPFISFDFGKQALPRESQADMRDLIKSKKYALQMGNFLATDSIVHLSYDFGNDPKTCIYNLHSGKLFDTSLLNYLQLIDDRHERLVKKMPFVTHESGGWYYMFTQPSHKFSAEENLPAKYATYNRLQHLTPDANPYMVRFKFGLE